jgi:hypothetical protein
MAKKLRPIDQLRISKENRLRQQTAARVETASRSNDRFGSRLISTDTDETDNQSYKSEENAPPVPRELRPTAIVDYFDLVKKIGVLFAVAAPVATGIWWMAKLDSKVESSASDILDIRPKVERILVTIEGKSERIKSLEKIGIDNDKEKKDAR